MKWFVASRELILFSRDYIIEDFVISLLLFLISPEPFATNDDPFDCIPRGVVQEQE